MVNRVLLFSISIISVDQDKEKSHQENLTYMKMPFGTLMSECIGQGLLSTNLSSFKIVMSSGTKDYGTVGRSPEDSETILFQRMNFHQQNYCSFMMYYSHTSLFIIYILHQNFKIQDIIIFCTLTLHVCELNCIIIIQH